MDGTALVLCNGLFATTNGKTAHGLVRGTDRYRILGVVDEPTAGRDAGEVLDGRPRGIPIFAALSEALAVLPKKPDFAIVGVATHGGRLTPEIRASLAAGDRGGLSVVNGLHEFAAEDPALAEAARRRGVDDHRRAQRRRQEQPSLLDRRDPRARDAACRRSRDRLRARQADDDAACWSRPARRGAWPPSGSATGQTGWLQGAPFGIDL